MPGSWGSRQRLKSECGMPFLNQRLRSYKSDEFLYIFEVHAKEATRFDEMDPLLH